MEKNKIEAGILLESQEEIMNRTIKNKHEAGVLLGPLFYEFCSRLYWICSNYNAKEDALLFMSRGGLRLKYLYELFLAQNNLSGEVRIFPFWISRFAAVKLTFAKNPELAVSHIVREFSYTNCRTMAKALLPVELYPTRDALLDTIPVEIGEAGVNRESFFNLYYCQCPYSEQLRQHFQEQRTFGMAYLRESFGDFKRLHTVDTGWFGSTLGSLQTGCDDWQWDALYFGRWNYRNEMPWYFNDIIGVMIDANGLKKNSPIDVLLEYHHLLEAVLEPDLPSTEYYFSDLKNNSMVEGWQNKIVGDADESMWSGIVEYFESAPAYTLPDVVIATQKVLKVWKHVLRYPTAAEAKILEVPARSADFGKQDNTSVFMLSQHKNRIDYWKNIKRSLWPPGAIAVSSKRCIFLKQLFWHVFKAIICYRGAV